MLRDPFGVNACMGPVRSFVVLDKSFLQGVNPVELQYYVQQGWVFGIPDVFWYEHFRKWDKRRLANLVKLKTIESKIVLLHGTGEMFQAEANRLKPAAQILMRRKVALNKQFTSSELFELDEDTKKITNERTAELENRLDLLIDAWLDFKAIPELQDANSEDMPAIIQDKYIQIRDDRDDIRGFYRNHRVPSYPAPELIDEEWVFFRWIQVALLAGLDFFASYGLGAPFNREDLFHELLDLDYLIPALVVGGLASCDKRMVRRFKFLRPDGVVFRFR